MQNEVIVEGARLERIEYRGQAVLSLPMVDKAHKRPEGTAGRTFRKFRDRFVRDKDYFSIPHAEWYVFIRRNTSDEKASVSGENRRYGGDMIFLTLSGYLMLVKTFTDDLSWKVQRALVDSYFKATQTVNELKDELIETQRRLIMALSRKKNKVEGQEVAMIARYKAQGLRTAQICEKIGRSASTVRKHTARDVQLGLFEAPQLV